MVSFIWPQVLMIILFLLLAAAIILFKKGVFIKTGKAIVMSMHKSPDEKICYISFRLEDGTVVDLTVSKNLYQKCSVGYSGYLTYTGTKCLGFEW